MVSKPYKITHCDHSKTIKDAWSEAINLLYVASVAAYPNSNKILIRMANKVEYLVHDTTYNDFINDINEAHSCFGATNPQNKQKTAATAAIQSVLDDEEKAKKAKVKALDLD